MKSLTTIRINKILTYKDEDVEIYRKICLLFSEQPIIRFDWEGHLFTGYLKHGINSKTIIYDLNIKIDLNVLDHSL